MNYQSFLSSLFLFLFLLSTLTWIIYARLDFWQHLETPDGAKMTDGSFRKPDGFLGIYLNKILSINSARCKERLANGYQPLERYLFWTISFQYGLKVGSTDKRYFFWTISFQYGLKVSSTDKRYFFSTISFQYGLRVDSTDICRIQYLFYRSKINSPQN